MTCEGLGEKKSFPARAQKPHSVLYGKPHIDSHALAGLVIRLSPRSVLGGLRSMDASLANAVLRLGRFDSTDVVVHAFCEEGALSLVLAQRVAQVSMRLNLCSRVFFCLVCEGVVGGKRNLGALSRVFSNAADVLFRFRSSGWMRRQWWWMQGSTPPSTSAATFSFWSATCASKSSTGQTSQQSQSLARHAHALFSNFDHPVALAIPRE